MSLENKAWILMFYNFGIYVDRMAGFTISKPERSRGTISTFTWHNVNLACIFAFVD